MRSRVAPRIRNWLVIVNGCETITCSRMFRRQIGQQILTDENDSASKPTAVRANVALWQALRELELIVGFDFDSQAYICELTLEVDSGGNVTHGDAAELL